MHRRILMALVVLTALLLPYTLKAQTGVTLPVVIEPDIQEPTLRFADDTWLSHDKLDHLAGGMVTTAVSSLLWQPSTNGDVWQRAGINVAAWFLYEVKDGLIDWKPDRTWGGDGFSYKDGIWSAVGVLLVTSVILTAR